MPYSYVDLQTIKSSGGLNIGTTVYDVRLRALTEHLSQQIDNFCNRHFYYTIETRFFDGDGSQQLLAPDLISIGTLLEDTNGDGTFETTWGTSDYLLYPRNAAPTGTHSEARPYSKIVVNDASNGTQDTFLRGLNRYKIVGTWGYSKVTRASGLNGTLSDATATSLVLSATATGTVEVGHTLLIEDEQVYVTATTGTSATVQRAQYGSTGTAHAGAAVSIIEYPGPVIEAVFIALARLWRRKDAAFSSFIISSDSQQSMSFRTGLDPDLKSMLNRYRRIAVA